MYALGTTRNAVIVTPFFVLFPWSLHLLASPAAFLTMQRLDRHRPRSCAQQSVREHQSIGKAGAGLAELDKRAVELQQPRDLADVRRDEASRRRGVADEIGEVLRH